MTYEHSYVHTSFPTQYVVMDDAAEWAESHPDVIRLLAIEEPTAQDLASFRSLLCAY